MVKGVFLVITVKVDLKISLLLERLFYPRISVFDFFLSINFSFYVIILLQPPHPTPPSSDLHQQSFKSFNKHLYRAPRLVEIFVGLRGSPKERKIAHNQLLNTSSKPIKEPRKLGF